MKHYHRNCLLCYFLVQIISSQGLPLGIPPKLNKEEDTVNSTTGTPNVVGAASLLPFLQKFGYLEGSNSSNHESDTLYTEESVQEAIKEMQKFGSLPQTGKLDKATLALLVKPRCGVADIIRERSGNESRHKRYVIGAKGWNKRRLTYRLENWPPQLSESTVEMDIRKAFNTWADYARLRFISKPRWNNDDVDISISFARGYHADGYPFDGSGGTLAHAFFPYGHGSLGGDIHFDLDENWGSNDDNDNKDQNVSDQISFFSVALHELGHSLGLSHSPSTDSVMFPYYQYGENGQAKNLRLGYDDIMAMYQLYIQRSIEDYPDTNDTTTESTTQISSVTSTTEFSPRPTSATIPPAATTIVSTDVTEKVDDSSSTMRASITEKPDLPNICIDGYDTISFIRNELFVFKNQFMWRFRQPGSVDSYYPTETSRLFPMLANVSKIDAAFESPDGNIYFFSGSRYWKYEDDGNAAGTSYPVSDFGLEGEHKINAAFIWEKNGKLYFFSGNLFWKFDIMSWIMEEGYPKRMERWRGLPQSGIDSVMRYSDGRTYFFQKDQFWRFDDAKVHSEEGFPMKASSFWFGC